jgi:DNA-binding CsgD family transcriptional regulator
VANPLPAAASHPETPERHFLSQRTVEYHLSSVYRKLDLSDRHGLAELFGSGG